MAGDAGEFGFAAVVALDDVEVGGIDGSVADADANVAGIENWQDMRCDLNHVGGRSVF